MPWGEFGAGDVAAQDLGEDVLGIVVDIQTHEISPIGLAKNLRGLSVCRQEG